MILYGASGHAKVIIEIIRSCGLQIDSIIDDDKDIKSIFDIPVLHEVRDVDYNKDFIIAIGNNRIRKQIAELFSFNFHQGVSHTKSLLSPSSEIGIGTVMMASSTVNTSTKIGNHCIINTGATIDHDCDIADFVHISPNVAIAGGVSIGEGSHVGIGAVVIPGITIGKWVTIGAGSVIIKDIPDRAVVVGNPGSIIKYME